MIVFIVVVTCLALGLHLRLDELALGGCGYFEQRESTFQVAFRLICGRLFFFCVRCVLETDDILTRYGELHSDAAAFDGNIERAVPMLMGFELPMLLGDGWQSDAGRQ